MAARFTSPDSMEKKAQSISLAHKNGQYAGAPQKGVRTKLKRGTVPTKESNPEWYASICNAAQKSKHQRVSKRSHKFVDKHGREFIFDSSWEDALAIRLDQLDVEWTRPDPIPYVLADGKERNYFPDFYLPKFDLYLDPKNPYVMRKQKEKLDAVSKIIDLVILESKEACTTFDI